MSSKPTYEKPKIEIITFELEESIASSVDTGSTLVCGENIFGQGSGE